jgi:hypothetical protein
MYEVFDPNETYVVWKITVELNTSHEKIKMKNFSKFPETTPKYLKRGFYSVFFSHFL